MAVEKIIEKSLPDKAVKVETPSPQAEKIASPETKAKNFSEKIEKPRETLKSGEKIGESSAAPVSVAQDFQKRQAEAIDNILAEGLNDIFLKMKPAEQALFKKKGEETVAKINELLGHTKVRVSKIIDLIRDWLKLIPGINKFFLEQEVKIKADKIIRLKDK